MKYISACTCYSVPTALNMPAADTGLHCQPFAGEKLYNQGSAHHLYMKRDNQ